MSTLATTNLKHASSGSNNIVLDSSGNVVLQAGTAAAPALQPTGDTNTGVLFPAADTVAISTGGSERSRVDSSGRLLVGTSSALGAAKLETLGNSFVSSTILARINSNDSNPTGFVCAKDRAGAIVQSGDQLGACVFRGYDGSNYVDAAFVRGEVDGTPGANDMPGRLVFSTTADGASSPTERMRITNGGQLLLGKTASNLTDTGLITVNPTTSAFYLALTNNATNFGDRVLLINRQNTDGDLIQFFQTETAEGSISVSGTTVSYNGGHLSRWSQLPNDEDPSPILKGTVMSNLDEMCEWGEEDNEQLNKTKVSDVEGDKNVAGLFVAPAPTEDGLLDFYLAMTGDMVIRIAAGTTVERGDLLMSAGDGTAKPQDDDIIRSKTIAKVTSTNVSCTYDDGSYCVPCVLMAC